MNRETSALSRMFQLAVRAQRLPKRPVFPERLEENGPRQGFFEHREYEAVRRHLPAPWPKLRFCCSALLIEPAVNWPWIVRR